MFRTLIPIAALLVLHGGAAAAQDTPGFYGTWDCMADAVTGSQGMDFNQDGYVQSDGQKRIGYTSVETFEGDYSIEFKDGFRLALVDIKDGRLTWRSLESGDEQVCTRRK